MTIPEQLPISGPYLGNGATVTFDRDFYIHEAGQTEVYLVDGDTESLVVSGYSQAGIGQNDGTVTFTTAPADGVKVVLKRRSEPSQDIDFNPQGGVSPAVIERGLDHSIMLHQESLVERGLFVRKNLGTDFDVVLPAPKNDRVLAWAENGLGLVNGPSVSELASAVATVQTLAQAYSADGEGVAKVGYLQTISDDPDQSLLGITYGHSGNAANSSWPFDYPTFLSIYSESGRQAQIVAANESKRLGFRTITEDQEAWGPWSLAQVSPGDYTDHKHQGMADVRDYGVRITGAESGTELRAARTAAVAEKQSLVFPAGLYRDGSLTERTFPFEWFPGRDTSPGVAAWTLNQRHKFYQMDVTDKFVGTHYDIAQKSGVGSVEPFKVNMHTTGGSGHTGAYHSMATTGAAGWTAAYHAETRAQGAGPAICYNSETRCYNGGNAYGHVIKMSSATQTEVNRLHPISGNDTVYNANARGILITGDHFSGDPGGDANLQRRQDMGGWPIAVEFTSGALRNDGIAILSEIPKARAFLRVDTESSSADIQLQGNSTRGIWAEGAYARCPFEAEIGNVGTSIIRAGGVTILRGRQARVLPLTNNTGGTESRLLAPVSGSGADGTLNNNFTALAGMIQQLTDKLVSHGLVEA